MFDVAVDREGNQFLAALAIREGLTLGAQLLRKQGRLRLMAFPWQRCRQLNAKSG